MMQERLSGEPTGAVLVASTLSILGAAELIGAFVVGWLLRFSAPAMLLAILYTLRTFSMLILHSASDTWHYLAFATVFGLTYMGTVIITSVMCLRCYGAEIKGKMFGFLFTVHQLMVFLTAWLGGMTYEFTQSYDLVTLSVMGFCMLSVFVGLILNRFEKKEVAPSMA
jgi:predicted MFS family arabinose efflux permease